MALRLIGRRRITFIGCCSSLASGRTTLLSTVTRSGTIASVLSRSFVDHRGLPTTDDIDLTLGALVGERFVCGCGNDCVVCSHFFKV